MKITTRPVLCARCQNCRLHFVEDTAPRFYFRKDNITELEKTTINQH